MKKSIIFIFIFSLPLLVSAQGVKFSFMASPQFSWFNTGSKNIENNGIKPGIRLGLILDNYFEENYAFHTGILLSTTGGRLMFNEKAQIRFDEITDSIPIGNILTYHLTYFSIPLGLKFTTREIGYSTFFVNLGLNADVRFQATADLPLLNYNRDRIQNEISLFSFSYFMGIGIKYSIGGNTAIVGGLMYKHGVNDILTSNGQEAVINSLIIQTGILF